MQDIHAYPPDTTFHDLIDRNKRNTVFLVIGMAVLTIVVFEAIAAAMMAYGSPEGLGAITWPVVGIAAGAAIVATMIGGTWSYFGGASTLLSISGAKPIKKEDDPQLYNVVEELALAAGLPVPKIHLIESKALNAFATGRDPEHASVAITTGLRGQLTRDELAGVMAHELAHVRHYDIRLTMMMATMVGLIVLACDVVLRSTFYGGMGRRRSFGGGRGGGKGGGGGAILLIILALLLAILAPLLAKMIQIAVSRQREYLADAGAVELTRYPQGLRDALRKLAADKTPLETANRATAHLYIVNPILHAKGRDNLNSLFATHPPVNGRISRLEALMR